MGGIRLQKRWAIYCAMLISSLFAYTINGDGSPVDYTHVAVSARTWGMGKSGIGLADDSSSILLNPAGLGQIRQPEVGIMSTKLLGEFNYTLINGVYPLQNETVGVSFLDENAGKIPGSDSLDQYGHPTEGDNIENYNRVFSLGYGRKAFLDNLYLGGTVKYTQKKIAFVVGNSTAVDLGAMYRWDSNITFGLAVKNIVQNGLTYSNSSTAQDHVDADYIGGVGWTLLDRKLLLTLDQHTNPKFGRTNAGAEYWLGESLALRCGVAERELTVGMGLRYEWFQFDYAMCFKELPLENQVFFSLTFGDARKAYVTPPDIQIVESTNITKKMDAKAKPIQTLDRPEEIQIIQ